MPNFLTKLQNLPDNQKKVIIVVVVIVAGLILAFFWVESAAKTISKASSSIASTQLPKVDIPDLGVTAPAENAAVTPLENLATKDWLTYSSADYGFEVKYPKEYSLKEYTKKEDYLLATVFLLRQKETASGVISPYISVSVYDQPDSIETWLKQQGVSSWSRNNNFLVDGKKVIKVINTAKTGTISWVLISYNNKLFRLENFDKDHFDDFVSTFKFTK